MAIEALSRISLSQPTGGVLSSPSQAESGTDVGRDFTALIADMAAQAATNLRQAEVTSAAGLRGQASVQEVAQSVMQAESSLQTVVALRDKAVSAYLELTRMAI